MVSKRFDYNACASHPKDKITVFAVNADMMRRNYNKQRKQIVYKLKNPRLTKITFHTLRHWKATTEYHKNQRHTSRKTSSRTQVPR